MSYGDLKEHIENKKNIPVPTYYFKIGDKVEIGNLVDVTISNIFEDNYFYEITYSTIETNYGRPIRHDNKKMIVDWMDIRKSNDNNKSLEENKDLRLNYQNRQLESLLHEKYYFGLNLNPDYQRDFVWNDQDQINLIDSIFKNIDIGKFVIIKYPYSEYERTGFDREVLDGKQRIKALLDYYEDRFEYKGCKFSDLCKHDKYHFENYSLSIAFIDNMNIEQKLRYFLMLNRSGHVMTVEHLNKVENMLNLIKE
jgi:hypothetical protein